MTDIVFYDTDLTVGEVRNKDCARFVFDPEIFSDEEELELLRKPVEFLIRKGFTAVPFGEEQPGDWMFFYSGVYFNPENEYSIPSHYGIFMPLEGERLCLSRVGTGSPIMLSTIQNLESYYGPMLVVLRKPANPIEG